MMLLGFAGLGFAGLGFAGYRRARGLRVDECAPSPSAFRATAWWRERRAALDMTARLVFALRRASVVAGGRGERGGGERAARRVQVIGVGLGGEAGVNPLAGRFVRAGAPVRAAGRAAESWATRRAPR
jgi:hypothetical protein